MINCGGEVGTEGIEVTVLLMELTFSSNVAVIGQFVMFSRRCGVYSTGWSGASAVWRNRFHNGGFGRRYGESVLITEGLGRRR